MTHFRYCYIIRFNLFQIKDVITSGSSVLETAALLRSQGLVVDAALVFLDREQGGRQILSDNGINVFCVTDISILMSILFKNDRIKQDIVDQVLAFTANNKVKSTKPGEAHFSFLTFLILVNESI
jgi:uridine monophosphate synthetase